MRIARHEWTYLLAGLAAVMLLVVSLRQVGVTNATTVALSLLIVVLWIATSSTLRVVVVCSIGSALALNFFFMPPVGTLTLADPEDWVALAVFLTVGFVARQLAASAEARTREALAERRESDHVRQKAELASAILASLAHDLRTPLTAIDVAVENLRNPHLADRRRVEQGQIAHAEVERLKHLLRDILEMARIDAAALAVTRNPVSAADIIDGALAALRPTLDHRTVKVDADETLLVSVDPLLTAGALSHLIENADQYSPRVTAIELRGSVDADGLHVVVRDHGDGLSADEVDRVFDRFFRGRAAQGHSAGAGIGLAIAHGLIAAQGGRLYARNATGGGAEFELVVPGDFQRAPSEVA